MHHFARAFSASSSFLLPLVLAGSLVGATSGCIEKWTSDSKPSIFGGSEADMSLPEGYSTVGIVIGRSICSGTVIHPRIVVSAKHCFDEAQQGRFILTTQDQGPGSESPVILKVELHPSADLALAVLNREIPQSLKRAVPILPPSVAIAPGSPVVEAGYGRTENEVRGHLYKVGVTSLPVRGAEIDLKSSGGHGSCKGDSGGPAYYKHAGQWYVIGATSRPANGIPNCGNETVIYTYLPAVLPWIKQKAQLHGFTLPEVNLLTIPRSGVARAHSQTFLKRSPGQSSELPPESKCQTNAGATLTYTNAESVDASHVKLQVSQVTGGCEGFTGSVFVYLPHFNFGN